MDNGVWKDYFAFSKRQRRAVYMLCIIIAIIIALLYFYSPQFKKPFVNQELQQQLIAMQKANGENDAVSSGNNQQQQDDGSENISSGNNGLHPFGFDPNTLDESGFQQMGLANATIQNILSYRQKGGHFNKPDDFRKIDGILKQDADVLVPYISILSSSQQLSKSPISSSEEIQIAVSKSAVKKLDINTATAEEWKALPGIGDVFSNRIVKFRNAINGFKSVEDIKRTYGLSDSVYQSILPYLTISDTASSKN